MLGNVLPDMGILLAIVGSELAKLVNPSAGRGQFCWRTWSVGVANVGRWLAVCTIAQACRKSTVGIEHRHVIAAARTGCGFDACYAVTAASRALPTHHITLQERPWLRPNLAAEFSSATIRPARLLSRAMPHYPVLVPAEVGDLDAFCMR